MIRSILPSALHGSIQAIASKSMAHRLLICAALSDRPTTVVCQTDSEDIRASVACLQAMGVQIAEQYQIQPGRWVSPCVLPCDQSGATLRFLLPVVSALGLQAEFDMQGRLPQRPLAPLDAQLMCHGVEITRPRADVLSVQGRLNAGEFILPGNISSQYISGLLLALPLLDERSTVQVIGKLESAAYVEMTLDALSMFGVEIARSGQTFTIEPQKFQSPGQLTVEADWSNAAFWLCAGALGSYVEVHGLQRESLQADRAIVPMLRQLGAKVDWQGDVLCVQKQSLRPFELDAAATPDLVPILAVLACAANGQSRIYNAGRLRYKESDRLASVCQMLSSLGADLRQTEDGLIICGTGSLEGGKVDSCKDHRIAMAAAIASIVCRRAVTISDAQAVDKSYPGFWEDFERLGGCAQIVQT